MHINTKRGAFDFETWEWVNPRCCAFVWGPPDAREREIFIDNDSKHPEVIARQALWHMARMPGEVKEWWGHNAGKFDALFLLEAAQSLSWKTKCHIAGGRIVTLKIQGPHGWFKIHDSYAVVQSPLKKAAESFQLQSRKLLSDDDYSVDVRSWSIERLRDGCYADCDVTLELLERVESLFVAEGGKLKATFSSSALTVVAAHAEVLDMRKLVHVNQTCRLAFCGGRVEVYRHTPQYALTEWDINSSYPAAMTHGLPWRHLGKQVDKAARAFEDPNVTGVVEATVEVPDMYLPPLPWRHPEHGGIYFPIGTWRGHFDRDELAYAMEQGVKLKSLHSMEVFSREQPFTQFINAFYALKSKSTGAEREFYKLCLNGCYGKFAQKPEKEEVIFFPDQEEAIDLSEENPGRVRFLSNRDYRHVAYSSISWSKQTHYALAGAITAQSRIRLHKYINSAQRIAYTDTDSIHADKSSSMGHLEGSFLGGLKVELSNYSGLFAAPKIYSLIENRIGGKEHYASKGFPVDKETFHKVLQGLEVETHRMRLAKRQVSADNKVRRVLMGRSWKGLSTKRRPLYDKDGDTAPWTVQELLNDIHLTAISPLAKWAFNR